MASEVKSSALFLFGLDFEGQVLGLGFGDPGLISLRGPGLDSRAEKYLRYFEAGQNICLLGLGQNRRQLRFNLHVQCSTCRPTLGRHSLRKCKPQMYAFGIDF
jgi:hypothetical protein